MKKCFLFILIFCCSAISMKSQTAFHSVLDTVFEKRTFVTEKATKPSGENVNVWIPYSEKSKKYTFTDTNQFKNPDNINPLSNCTLTCPANIVVNNTPGQCGAIVSFPPTTTSGTCGPVTTTPASGSFFPVGTTTVTSQTSTSPVLYTQSGAQVGASASQNFQPSQNNFDCNAADDFTVPNGQIWTITQVNVEGQYSSSTGPATLNVTFYNNSGNIPGSVITVFNDITTFSNGPNFNIMLPTSVVLNPGTYWISVQVNLDNSTNGQWLWKNFGNTNIVSEFAFQNPGGGFGPACPTYNPGFTVCGGGGGGRNLMFSVIGTIAPSPVLYSQSGTQVGASASQNFQPSQDNFDCNAADDFEVPAGQTWTITQLNVEGQYSSSTGPATLNVTFYNNSGNIPGSVITVFNDITTFSNGPNFNIMLPTSVVLNPGTYWVSVQVNLDNSINGQWLWKNFGTTNIASEFAFQNPGGGFGPACPTYNPGFTVCGGGGGGRNLMFSVIGTADFGSPASCTFTVTVIDNEAPIITCPAPVSVSCISDVPAVNIAAVAASDNCPGVVVIHISDAVSNQTCANRYTITRTYRATDASGNYTECAQIITVNDHTVPTLTCPAPVTVSCASAVPSPNIAMVTGVNDNCGGTVTVTHVSDIISNQTCANRFTITRTYRATDACGNFAECTQIITVNDQTAPALTCPATITVNCASAVPAPNIALVTGVSDNCGGTVTVTHISDVISNQTCANRFTINRTYRATDACGNFAECNQVITVNDQTPPVITCPVNITTTTPIGSCTAVVNFAVFATDNCSGAVTIANSPASGSSFPVGTTTVNSTATDACGNVSACTFTITVLDGQFPVITTQPVNKTVCSGSSTVFSIAASNVVSYQWQQWNGSAWINISGATGSSFTLSNTTVSMNTNTYRVVLTGLCTTINSNPATLNVNPLPVVSLMASPLPPVLLPAQSTDLIATVAPAGGSFAWFKNGVVLPGITAGVLANRTVNDIGSYHFVYTDHNGCSVSSAALEISGDPSDFMWLYPNPNQGVFYIRFYNMVGEQVVINVYNSLGQKVYQHNAVTGTTAYTEIDVRPGLLPHGVYVVELLDGKGKRRGIRKILIKNL